MQAHDPAEQPESSARPVAEIVSGEAAPPSDTARAQIPEPEPELPPSAPRAAPVQMPPPLEVPDGREWREVAAGRVRARRKRPAGAGVDDEERGSTGLELGAGPSGEGAPDDEGPKAPPLTPEAAAVIRGKKAEGYVQLVALGLAYFARRWGVDEKEIAFTPDESQALTSAVEPLVTVDEDPWTNLFMVGAVVIGPRLKTLNAAAAEKSEQPESA